MFEIKLCKTKSAIIVKPVRNVKLDLAKMNKSFNVIAQTSIASVLKIDNEEVVVHRYGDIYFKSLKDESLINKIAQEIYKIASG